MARTERESERRRKEDLLVLPIPAESLQNGAGYSEKNLNIQGLPKRKERHQRNRESSWQVRYRVAFAKRKRYRTICPDHKIVKWEKLPHNPPILGKFVDYRL